MGCQELTVQNLQDWSGWGQVPYHEGQDAGVTVGRLKSSKKAWIGGSDMSSCLLASTWSIREGIYSPPWAPSKEEHKKYQESMEQRKHQRLWPSRMSSSLVPVDMEAIGTGLKSTRIQVEK